MPKDGPEMVLGEEGKEIIKRLHSNAIFTAFLSFLKSSETETFASTS